MSEEEINAIKLAAKKFVKENKKVLIEKFASAEKYSAHENPMTFFMAGSAGSGKTEFSKSFVLLVDNKIIKEKNSGNKSYLVRIDADEIREMLPGYNGKNSSYFQEAVSLGVNKIFDHVIKKKLSFLLDGTFASWEVSRNNVEICLRKNRQVDIFYIYQDPILSWRLTKARETKEGRVVPMQDFVDDLFNSRENVNKIKKMYGDQINLTLIIKGYDNKIETLDENIDNIDNYHVIDYNKTSLLKQLNEIK